MRILIIGGTGLISTGITRQLIERGDDLTIYNRGQHEADLPAPVKRLYGDRTDYCAFEAQMAAAGEFDCVIDMVCFVRTEAESAIRAFAGRAGQHIFCSTVDVYTKPAKRYPIREDAERVPSPAFPYAYNKGQCEEALLAAQDRSALNLTIIRPAHTYGESKAFLHSLNRGSYLLDRLRKGEPIIVHGDGTSLWSACHRDDVARAFVGAIGNPNAYGRAYHVAADEWLTWNSYYQQLAQAVGGPDPDLVHIPTDLLARVAPKQGAWTALNFAFDNIFDTAAAHQDLGFRYTIPFQEGARRAVAWLDAHGEIEDSADYPFYDRIIEAWRGHGQAMVEELAYLDA